MSKVITRTEAIQLLKDGYILIDPGIPYTAYIASPGEPTVRSATYTWLIKQGLVEQAGPRYGYWHWKPNPPAETRG